jgi:hypothetical protein
MEGRVAALLYARLWNRIRHLHCGEVAWFIPASFMATLPSRLHDPAYPNQRGPGDIGDQPNVVPSGSRLQRELKDR